MTPQDLYEDLRNIPSLSACTEYIQRKISDLAVLFTSAVNDADVLDQSKFIFEDAFLALDKPLLGNEAMSNEVKTLLLFFASIFEKAFLYTNLQRISNIIRDDSLSNRLTAIYLFKSITDTTTEYRDRFQRICKLLLSVYNNARPRIKSQCEDIAIEYFTESILQNRNCGFNYRNTFGPLFYGDRHNFPFLNTPGFQAVLRCPQERLKEEGEAARIRVAEAFFDEAMAFVPLPVGGQNYDLCNNRDNCTDGLHEAKRQLVRDYPREFARTAYFVKQALNRFTHEPFQDAEQCVRYFRQYMPLHIPQLEEAIKKTLHQRQVPQGTTLKILDVGSGPGTLYIALAGLINRGDPAVTGLHFEYNCLEPSNTFLAFFDVVQRHVRADRLTSGRKIQGTLGNVANNDISSINWIFLGNVITPLINNENGNVQQAANRLINIINGTIAHPLIVALAENSATTDFSDFCNSIATSLNMLINPLDINVPAPDFTRCRFNVFGRNLTQSRLKLCVFVRH